MAEEQQTTAPVETPAAEQPTQQPAPETPAPETPAPETPPAEAPKKPIRLSAREAVREIAQKFKQQQRPRDEQGRFKGDEAPPSEDPPAETPAEEPTDTPAAAPGVADGEVRIELPQGHALREQGHEHFDVPEHLEKTFRASLNSWTRRSEVEQASAAAKQAADEATRLREQVARLQAEQRLASSGELDKLTDPKLQQMLEQAEQHDPDRAKILREALDAQKREIMAREGEKAVRETQDQEAGQRFLQQFWSEVPRLYQVWHGQGEHVVREKVAPIIAAYGKTVDDRMARGGPGPDVNEFFRDYLDPQYARDPAVVQKVKAYRDAEAEKIRRAALAEGRAAAEKELEQKQREAADRHGRRPPNAPAAAQAQGAATPEDDPIRNAPPGQRHKAMRSLARKVGQRFAGR